MGSDEDPADYDKSRKLFIGAQVAAGIIGAGFFLFVCVWVFAYGGGVSSNNSPAYLINIHIIVMSFFVVFLQGHSSLMFRTFPAMEKWPLKCIHGAGHAFVVLGAIVGLSMAISYHNEKNVPHFFTLHSWIGLAGLVGIFLQYIAGFSIFLLPFAPTSLRRFAIKYHMAFGPLIFMTCGSAGITGIMMKAVSSLGSNYPLLIPEAYWLNFAALFFLLFMLIIIFLLTSAQFKRRPRPEGELLLSEQPYN